jgi:hypothetical protein
LPLRPDCAFLGCVARSSAHLDSGLRV